MAKPKAGLVSLNHKDIGRVLTGDAMYDALEAEATRVLENVKDAAEQHRDTGAYIESLHLERDLTDRAVVRIVSDDPGGLPIEARDAPMAVGLNRSRRA